MNATVLQPSDLDHFTGTNFYWKHGFNRRLLYTDGVKYFAEKAKAYWFIDAIAVGVHGRRGWAPQVVPYKTPFAVIIMTVKNGECRTVIQNDEPGEKLGEFKTPTACPEGVWKFYLEEGDNTVVLMLPSEH
jgi:hypothetical protein